MNLFIYYYIIYLFYLFIMNLFIYYYIIYYYIIYLFYLFIMNLFIYNNLLRLIEMARLSRRKVIAV